MHTDEYEIALSKEIAVCSSTIGRIRKTLALMERKYGITTEEFVDGRGDGCRADPAEKDTDFRVWRDTHASLQRWRELEQQYRQQLRIMKI